MNTYDIKEQVKVREILSANNIEYFIKCENRTSAGSFSPHSRGMIGRVGENRDLECKYIVYVKKNDFEEANYLIRSIHEE